MKLDSLKTHSDQVKNESVRRTKELINKMEIVLKENELLSNTFCSKAENSKKEKKVFLKEIKNLQQ